MADDLAHLLGPDDHVVLRTRQHWFVLVRRIGVFVLALILALIVYELAQQPDWLDNGFGDWVGYALLLLALVFLVMSFWRIIGWWKETLYVTTTKVAHASGVFNRNIVSTPLVKIDEVLLVRPLLGRMLGFGRLEVADEASGHGKRPLAGLEYLPKAEALYQQITERARHQRMLEGSNREDTDGDGYVDESGPTAR
jgi:uncharacterized membrane protein YdbT with pleckstrin-like domain